MDSSGCSGFWYWLDWGVELKESILTHLCTFLVGHVVVPKKSAGEKRQNQRDSAQEESLLFPYRRHS